MAVSEGNDKWVLVGAAKPGQQGSTRLGSSARPTASAGRWMMAASSSASTTAGTLTRGLLDQPHQSRGGRRQATVEIVAQRPHDRDGRLLLSQQGQLLEQSDSSILRGCHKELFELVDHQHQSFMLRMVVEPAARRYAQPVGRPGKTGLFQLGERISCGSDAAPPPGLAARQLATSKSR
jgi:hypothetical protein